MLRARAFAAAGAAAALLAVLPVPGRASGPAVSRIAIVAAEDARAATPEDLRLLIAAAGAARSPMQAMAVRALGRLERPGLVATLAPLVGADAAAVRAEAAWSLAQSVGADAAAATAAREAIGRQLLIEKDAGVRGALAEALGHLPIDSAGAASETERMLVEVASRIAVTRKIEKSAAGPTIVGLTLSRARVVAVPEPALVGALRGLEAYSRARARDRQGFEPGSLERLKAIARGEQGAPPQARLLAMMCLLPVNAVDPELAAGAMTDAEPQVRRLALSSSAADLPAIRRGLKDPSWIVRDEALRRYGQRFQAAEGCEPIVGAIGANVDHQSLLAIDLLGGPCRPGDHAVETLIDFAAGVGGSDWHRPAHAIVALVKAAPERSRGMLSRFLGAADWRARVYAARAAGVLRDQAALRRLAADRNDNVREAAIDRLSAVAGHDADDEYLATLGAADFQLVATSAKALAGSPARAAAVPALLATLARLTALDSDTSRDPRVALLERLEELGSAAEADHLRPYAQDPDPRVAALAARILTKWTGHVVEAAPRPRPAAPFVLTEADLDRLSRSAIRVTMEGGGQFEMRLLADLAPVAAAKFASLAGQGYYNGLSFWRVLAPQIVQGGSPGANEFSGGARYWRDEVGPTTQTRGTVGLSTRGRDTGDAQIYINLVDKPRYDREYTIFAEVTSGMEVVDAILEGDVMQKVEVVPAKKR